MAQVYLDSYLIMVMAIDYTANNNLVVKMKHIVHNMRKCIKILYANKVISNVHSCIAELLHTALSKYADLSLIEIGTYGNKKGSTTAYMLGNTANQVKINEMIKFLLTLSNRSAEQVRLIEEEVSNNM